MKKEHISKKNTVKHKNTQNSRMNGLIISQTVRNKTITESCTALSLSGLLQNTTVKSLKNSPFLDLIKGKKTRGGIFYRGCIKAMRCTIHDSIYYLLNRFVEKKS